MAAVAAGALLAVAGCAPEARAPDPEPSEDAPPGDQRVSGAERNRRAVRDAALRVRNVTCTGVASGSGFAITDDVLVTNRHVVMGASRVQVTSWDGRTLETGVRGVALDTDLAVLQVQGRLPRPVTIGGTPEPGQAVTVAGYPRGGEITIEDTEIAGITSGAVFGESGPVIELDAPTVAEGSSGGPVLDEDGEVVAVVFAIERGSGDVLAVPAERIEQVAARTGFQSQPDAC